MISYEESPTIIEAVRECEKAWQLAKRYVKNGSADTEIYTALAAAFPSLSTTYPIILSEMSVGNYSRAVCERFFKYVQNNVWKSEDEHLEILSAYAGMIHREKHPHASSSEIAEVRRTTYEALRDNARKLRELREYAEKETARIDGERAAIRARELRSLLSQSTAAPESIVVQFDG